MLNQFKFELKSLRKGYLVGTVIVIAINLLLLLFSRFTRFGNFPGAIFGTAVSGLAMAGFFICFIVFLFQTFSRLYSRNKGLMTFLTGTKGSSVLLSRIFVIGIALALVFVLGIFPVILHGQNLVDSVQDGLTTFGDYGFSRFFNGNFWIGFDGWELVQDFFSFMAVIALMFFAGACYRSVLVGLSARFLIAIVIFIMGSYILPYFDILAFLPESWRINPYFMGQISIEASAGPNITTMLYILVQIGKVIGLSFFGGWLLDKKLDYSA